MIEMGGEQAALDDAAQKNGHERGRDLRDGVGDGMLAGP